LTYFGGDHGKKIELVFDAHFALPLDGYSLLLAPDPSCHRENMVEARPRKVEECRRNGVNGNGLRRIAVTLDIV
jgi:hypothetical protein